MGQVLYPLPEILPLLLCATLVAEPFDGNRRLGATLRTG